MRPVWTSVMRKWWWSSICLKRLEGVGELAIVIDASLSMFMGTKENVDWFGERWKGTAGDCAGPMGIFHSWASCRSHLRERAARKAAMNSDFSLKREWANCQADSQKRRSAAKVKAALVRKYLKILTQFCLGMKRSYNPTTLRDSKEMYFRFCLNVFVRTERLIAEFLSNICPGASVPAYGFRRDLSSARRIVRGPRRFDILRYRL